MDPEFVWKFSFSGNVHACSTNTLSGTCMSYRENTIHTSTYRNPLFCVVYKPSFHPKGSALTPNPPLKQEKTRASRVAAQTGNTIPRAAPLGFVFGGFQDATGQIPEETAQNSVLELF